MCFIKTVYVWRITVIKQSPYTILTRLHWYYEFHSMMRLFPNGHAHRVPVSG